MTTYEQILWQLKREKHTWLITGVAGFIGSNLLEMLLTLDQIVVGIDNFSTGFQSNLDEVKMCVSDNQWSRFRFIEGDIRSLSDCKKACAGVEYVLHEAALGSVPRSIENPILTNETNVSGFLNMLVASRDEKVNRFVYAASSSTYGDHPALPKIENQIGSPLSPYAITKYVNELYAEVFSKVYGIECVGLRYFNVFGPRQNPNGAYAAVIPKWIDSLINNQPVLINGDGETSRDFCYISNVKQANLLAAMTQNLEKNNDVFNVALGERTSLNELYKLLKTFLMPTCKHLKDASPHYLQFRDGDVRHSQADVRKIKTVLGYEPTHRISEGLKESINWYLQNTNVRNKTDN